ncbi:hypothetical protein GUY61_11885 [Streptomyces sp. GC420]|nr:hypothetical protein [Streptomyces sp. GC420]NBM16328.1 hypothetical protein [Streptomyces sp. GC420]
MTHTPTAAPPRRTAWSEGVDRARAAATTEPGRLRIIGAVLAALVIAFGAVTAWEMSERTSAADSIVDRSQPLSRDAADIYRSLADANTTAASGFLAGGEEKRSVRLRYEKDIAEASRKLAKAAAGSSGSVSSTEEITRLNERLAVYTGLIETARANNRQGLPLGGAYLRHANDMMQNELLESADRLYRAETARLDRDYDEAKGWPYFATATGLLALGFLAWAQRRNYLRTNRVFNHGLVAATAACGVVLLWLVAGHSVARAQLTDSYEHGARSLQVLNKARIASLQARGDENLTLVARGAVTETVGGRTMDAYEVGYQAKMETLVGTDPGKPAPGSLLGEAAELADDPAGGNPVQAAAKSVSRWDDKHREARAADDGGNYDGALADVIGERDSTGNWFDKVDDSLAQALGHEQSEFRQAANDGRGALTGLPLGAAVLAVLGAAGAILGIGRRLSEYR